MRHANSEYSDAMRAAMEKHGWVVHNVGAVEGDDWLMAGMLVVSARATCPCGGRETARICISTEIPPDIFGWQVEREMEAHHRRDIAEGRIAA